MPSILVCPSCESFLLVKESIPSPLDGRRPYSCLGCGLHIQPPRSRSFLRFALGLAYLLFLPCLVAGVYLLSVSWWIGGWGWRAWQFSGLSLAGAMTCVAVAGVIRDVLKTPAAVYRPTDEYPQSRVQLIEFRVRLGKDTVAKPTLWVKPLAEFVSQIIETAGVHLSGAKNAHKVCLKFNIQNGTRETSLSFRGTPSKSSLNALYDEIEQMPVLQTLAAKVSLEIWFRVRA